MFTTVLSTIVVVLVAALAACLVWVVRVVSHMADEFERPESTRVIVQEYDDAWIHSSLKDLALAVGDGIEKVERSERRVRSVVASAKRRFESEGYVDPGLEAEELPLPLNDATGSAEPELPGVQEDMERSPWLGVPGRVE